MSTAIILAGGRSSRSGRIHKGLRQLNATDRSYSWLEHQVEQLRNAGYSRIIIATGYRSRRLIAKVGSLKQMHNPTPEQGPFSTLKAALRGFQSGHTLLVPIDTPVPKPGVMHKLRCALHGKLAAKPCHQGRGAHPLLLSQDLVRKIRSTDIGRADARLDKQLHQLEYTEIGTVEVTATEIHRNLNTELEWRKYKRLI